MPEKRIIEYRITDYDLINMLFNTKKDEEFVIRRRVRYNDKYGIDGNVPGPNLVLYPKINLFNGIELLEGTSVREALAHMNQSLFITVNKVEYDSDIHRISIISADYENTDDIKFKYFYSTEFTVLRDHYASGWCDRYMFVGFDISDLELIPEGSVKYNDFSIANLVRKTPIPIFNEKFFTNGEYPSYPLNIGIDDEKDTYSVMLVAELQLSDNISYQNEKYKYYRYVDIHERTEDSKVISTIDRLKTIIKKGDRPTKPINFTVQHFASPKLQSQVILSN